METAISDRIEQRICLIRGQKVMLERDLAVLYGVDQVVEAGGASEHRAFP